MSYVRPLFAITLNYDDLSDVRYSNPSKHFNTIAHGARPVLPKQNSQSLCTISRPHYWRLVTQSLKRLGASPIILACYSILHGDLLTVLSADLARRYSMPLRLWRLTDLHSQASCTLPTIELSHPSATIRLRAISLASCRSYNALRFWCLYLFNVHPRL